MLQSGYAACEVKRDFVPATVGHEICLHVTTMKQEEIFGGVVKSMDNIIPRRTSTCPGNSINGEI